MNERFKFLFKNLVKGVVWLLIIIALYLLFRHYTEDADFEHYLERIYDKPFWFFLVFGLSEIVFGIIPPELFMLVSAHAENLPYYIFTISILALFSYGAGVLGFFIGKYFNKTRFYYYLQDKYLEKYVGYLKRFGGFIIIVASLTPLPFSAIAMLVGAIGFPTNKYYIYSLFRFLRFIIYSILIFRTTLLA